ncbi:diacylglycerol/lipid kinase family protein [Flavobacterium cerinum]|uniref:Diacylglycerol kinase family lipid kinase n=1 Tax=Flavobacterium cerinum TaxID=2502784 RepID=A0A3S3Q834_9FLAO|nr:diacylglycerol kinase family protein [Flavobacterium cerinum]RWW92355.1 diacylglycerol kinase family lipid kinase [Flavobacterium cerinum]
MLYIHFIVNPISGKGKHVITHATLKTFFPADMFRIEVDYTEYKKHATELTKKAAANNPDYIVACGGDGTINEVASCLINTSIKLGIIPVGSGNGLSAHLQIPKNIEQALQLIITGQSTSIDVGKLNDKYFFSNMGVGIDAMIIRNYESSGRRTLLTYIKASLAASMEFKPQKTALSFKNKVVEENSFMLFISNSNEMGYNMSLTPKASLNDGMLDLITVPQLSFPEKLALGYYVLRNKVDKFKKAQHTLVDNLHIELPEKIFTDAQIDGEYHNLKTNSLKVSIIKHGLEVIIP